MGYRMCKLSELSEEQIDQATATATATASHFRGKGVGTWIIHYLCANFPYEFCVLDVYSKSPDAKRFYERLGFEQVKIKSDLMLRLRGNRKTITMRLDMKKRRSNSHYGRGQRHM